jgi:hypothetical protein
LDTSNIDGDNSKSKVEVVKKTQVKTAVEIEDKTRKVVSNLVPVLNDAKSSKNSYKFTQVKPSSLIGKELNQKNTLDNVNAKLKNHYYNRVKLERFKKNQMDKNRRYAKIQDFHKHIYAQRKHFKRNITENPNINRQREAYVKYQQQMVNRQMMISKNIERSRTIN